MEDNEVIKDTIKQKINVEVECGNFDPDKLKRVSEVFDIKLRYKCNFFSRENERIGIQEIIGLPSTLDGLDLSHNNIGDKTADLRFPQGIVELNVSYNFIIDTTVAKSIRVPSTVQLLILNPQFIPMRFPDSNSNLKLTENVISHTIRRLQMSR